jgi:hypothetical protein
MRFADLIRRGALALLCFAGCGDAAFATDPAVLKAQLEALPGVATSRPLVGRRRPVLPDRLRSWSTTPIRPARLQPAHDLLHATSRCRWCW